MKRAIILLSTMLAAFASAQDAASALADAQKAYVSGDWKVAAAAYEKACPLQPKDKQPECLLWNVLALSQTGEAASFKKAGKRLDSLVQKVNPQEDIYADLMMTSAQFRLYLGKYDKAAEDLIHAIETSKPHHNVVLQKVCSAVKTKVHNENLAERCESLKNPQPIEQPVQTATPVQSATSATSAQPEATAAAPAQSSSSAVSVQPAAPAQTAAAQPAAPVQPVAAPASSSAAAQSVASKTAEQPKVQSSSSVAAAPIASAAPIAQATPVAPAAPVAQAVPATPAQAASAPEAPTAQPAPAQTAPAPVVKADPTDASEPYWVLQLGAFGVKNNANLLVSTLKKRKIQANIVEQPRGEKTLYLVQTGRFATKDAAVDYGAKQLAPLKVEFQPLFRK